MSYYNKSSSPIPGQENQEKPFFELAIHQFFIIPFLIAVGCVMLFTVFRLLTKEQPTVYNLLEDIKISGSSRRWQAAFELSRILTNQKLIPKEERFMHEMTSAFEKSLHDDDRVRQYLALAMGRTGNLEFFKTLTEDISHEKEDNLYAIIYALGMLKDPRSPEILKPFLNHNNPRVRSITVVSLGNLTDPVLNPLFKQALHDSEPNVQWGAAMSLAKNGDNEGKPVIIQLLERKYLSSFPEVDKNEQDQLILSAIEAASSMKDPEVNEKIKFLSQNDPNMKVRASALKWMSL